MKDKHVDTNNDEMQYNKAFKPDGNVNNNEMCDKIGDVVILRNDKSLIIKVKNIRLYNQANKSVSTLNTSDYNEKMKNMIVMSIKQGMKLLLDNDNNYRNIVDKLYYKFGRLMI